MHLLAQSLESWALVGFVATVGFKLFSFRIFTDWCTCCSPSFWQMKAFSLFPKMFLVDLKRERNHFQHVHFKADGEKCRGGVMFDRGTFDLTTLRFQNSGSQARKNVTSVNIWFMPASVLKDRFAIRWWIGIFQLLCRSRFVAELNVFFGFYVTFLRSCYFSRFLVYMIGILKGNLIVFMKLHANAI